MSNEVERKVNCGVWTALELLISRGSSSNVWEKNDFEPKPAMVRRREKVRIRKYLTPILDNVQIQQGNETSSRLSTYSISPQNSCTAPNQNIKVNASKTKKNKIKTPEVQMPLIDCSITLPRVNAQLERLMGSNVVHLTDRKYMMELGRRINDDFNNMLLKRIQKREVGEMQRQRVLLMEGKLTKCPKELRNHPVYTLNEAKNNYIVKRRGKLKTTRERVSERLLRLSKKWEAEHVMYAEEERKREAEMKIKELEVLTSDKQKIGKEMAMDKRVSHGGSEMDMQHFLKNENDRMLNRLKPNEKQFKPFTKDLRLVDAKRRMSEASIPKMKLMIAKLTKKMAATKIQSKNDPSSEDRTTDYDYDTDNDIKPNEMQKEYESLNRVYVNPMIAELKQTNNVKEMYAIAEKIVGNNIDKYLYDASKSTETNEEIASQP